MEMHESYRKHPEMMHEVMYMGCPHCGVEHDLLFYCDMLYCPQTNLVDTGMPVNIMECLYSNPDKVFTKFPSMSVLVKKKIQRILPSVLTLFEESKAERKEKKSRRKMLDEQQIANMEYRLRTLEYEIAGLHEKTRNLQKENAELRRTLLQINNNSNNNSYAANHTARMLEEINCNLNFIADK